MKTFKAYKTYKDTIMDEIKENLIASPFFFTWIPDSDINSEYELVARRKIECDNIQVSSMIKEDEFTVSIDSTAHSTIPVINITLPYLIWGEPNGPDGDSEKWMDLENNKMFVVEDLSFRGNEWRTKLLSKFNMLHNMSYNFYVNQTGTLPEKTIKTIEYVKQFAERNDPDFWLPTDEKLLSRLKMKYLRNDQLTDDDYAMNAALNL